MKSSRSSHIVAFTAAALALVLSLVLGPAHAGETGDNKLSKEDQACLDCHAKAGVRKTLSNGETLSLYIAPEAFAASKHARVHAHTQSSLGNSGAPVRRTSVVSSFRSRTKSCFLCQES